jgi:acyl carrier protein
MLEKITSIIREYKNDDNLQITESTEFAQLDLDSLDIVELVMNVEDVFGITLDMDDPVATVGELKKLIEERV